jgi:alpha-L-rhamnosidase
LIAISDSFNVIHAIVQVKSVEYGMIATMHDLQPFVKTVGNSAGRCRKSRSCQLQLLALMLLVCFAISGSRSTVSTAAQPIAAEASAAFGAEHLRCNGLLQPTITASEKPSFSWIIRPNEPDQHQSAYQVEVEGVWDSGRVDSDQSINVQFAGKPFEPGRLYRWRVKLWDAHGKESAWSEAWTFFTGPNEWLGQWIGLDDPVARSMSGAHWIWYPEGQPEKSAPIGTRYFRRTVILPKDANIKAAVISIIADNSFELRVNGDDAGSSNTPPPHVVKLDLGSKLHSGTNRLLIAAINEGSAPNPAGLYASLHIELDDGKLFDVPSDEQWACSIDRKAWVPAKVLGPYGMQPWGLVGVEGKPLPARYVRREFKVDKPISRATAYVCGLGFFNLSVNGNRISDDMMDPALSDYNKVCYYVTFDVTHQVKTGNNAVGVVLGNGRYFTPRGVGERSTYGFPKLLFQMKLDYTDGTSETFYSDQTWRITDDGPIRANNEYQGESYDARMAMPGWDSPNFDDQRWKAVELCAAPQGVVLPQTLEPMKVTQILQPVSVNKAIDGSYIVDMGQNFYGTVQLKAEAPRGTEINLTSAYALKADGTLKVADNRSARGKDDYIFSGNGIEVWHPQFRGQGFRHVKVTGFPGVLSGENFQGLVIHTDAEPVGQFECSNDLVNRIHSALCWGSRMFLRSAPLDPDRDERQAWMGDPAKDAESEAYNYNVFCFYRKWMDDVERCQRPDGSIPSVAMYWDIGDGVEWPAVFTIIPDWFIDFYGDTDVAKTHYNAMKKWVLAMRRHERPDGTLTATSYGDWCDTYTMGGKIDDFGQTPRDLISSAYQYHNYRIMARLANLLDKSDDEKTFSDLASALKDHFNRTFLDVQTHTYSGDTQCSYLLPIAFGLVPADQRDAIIGKLVDDILIKHHGHLSVGLVGMQWLMQTLTDIGRPDVAWTIVTQKTIPSWGYMISKGATTIWERWDYESRGPGMNSEALLIQAGNLDAWFYQTIGGIRPASPGFKRILIQPSILGDLTWEKAHFDSPYGRIESDWELKAHRLIMHGTVPANTTATIVVPGSDGGTHTVGSGPYRFESRFDR